jgi:hypothetical protein
MVLALCQTAGQRERIRRTLAAGLQESRRQDLQSACYASAGKLRKRPLLTVPRFLAAEVIELR